MNICTEWSGHKNPLGYGIAYFNGVQRYTHRLAYCLYKGLPLASISNLKVCHACDNPSCYNAGHLFLGTQSDNMKDMYGKSRDKNQNTRKTVCPSGHEYDGTYKTQRVCKTCRSEAGKKRYREAQAYKNQFKKETVLVTTQEIDSTLI